VRDSLFYFCLPISVSSPWVNSPQRLIFHSYFWLLLFPQWGWITMCCSWYSSSYCDACRRDPKRTWDSPYDIPSVLNHTCMILFIQMWRSVCPGGYAALAQACLCEYHGTAKLTWSTSSHAVWAPATGSPGGPLHFSI
jgi:hypothetical protein